MEMYQIRYFLAVCETLNFTRTSEKCFVSQPSLTKAIQKLEDNLGGRLFNRTKNSVEMTELGKLMQPNLEQIYNAAREAREQAKSFVSGQTGKLRLGVMCSVCMDPITMMLSAFQADHTDIELHFEEGTMEKLCDKIDKGELDTAILASPYEFPARFETVPLYSEEYVIACPPNHPLLAKGNIGLKDLHNAPYVSRENCEYSKYIEDMLEDQKVALDVRQSSEREDWIQTMIRAGMGVAFMPEISCLAAGLPACRIDSPEIVREIQILTLATQEKSRTQRDFIDHATTYDWDQVNAGLSRNAA